MEAAIAGTRLETAARRFVEGVFKIEVVVTCGAFLLVATALIADVVAREIIGSGLYGAQKFAVFCTAVAGLLGFAVVVQTGGHLRVQAVDKLFPTAWHPAMARIGSLISCAICAFFAVYAAEFLESSIQLNETDMVLEIPVWPIQIAVPYLFAISALRYALFFAFPAIRPAEKEHE